MRLRLASFSVLGLIVATGAYASPSGSPDEAHARSADTAALTMGHDGADQGSARSHEGVTADFQASGAETSTETSKRHADTIGGSADQSKARPETSGRSSDEHSSSTSLRSQDSHEPSTSPGLFDSSDSSGRPVSEDQGHPGSADHSGDRADEHAPGPGPGNSGVAVPEPASALIVVGGLAGIAVLRRRQRRG